ncbi:unnamed protein product [Cladocopium goreaui]|uniref:Uncharacterized protein n=1 Tax=Cladocopium goreaui TaxID=2562237 RepID=A0A9P1G708_9DINO|nr:unnamed protein product [Cladocopium goreaui]
MCSFEEVLKRPITHSQLLGKKERCQASSKASCKEHFKLLGQLSPHARRCMLDSLTEAQRCTLERWILRRKSMRSSKDMARMARRRVQSTSWQAAKGPGFGIHRHRRAGRIAYRAGVNIGPLRLHSVYYADMTKAQSVLEVMLRIQQKIRQELAHTKRFEGGLGGWKHVLVLTPQKHRAMHVLNMLKWQESPSVADLRPTSRFTCLKTESSEQFGARGGFSICPAFAFRSVALHS